MPWGDKYLGSISLSFVRGILAALGIATVVLLLLYSRSWPFPPLFQYPKAEAIKVCGTWRKGQGLVATRVVYASNGQSVRDPIVRWEVRRYARGFIAGPNRPGGEVVAEGAFVYRPCPPGIARLVWCQNYEWGWLVPSFLPMNDSPPLENAVAASNTLQIEALIHAGADVNAVGQLGETAIWSARTPEVAGMLVAAGASVEAPVNGVTALMGAASARDAGRVQALLAAGANPNAKDEAGRTPLLYALHPALFRQDAPSPALITELLRAGANANVRDREGVTPLVRAVQGGWPDIVRLLLEAHADVNARDDRGETALSMARDQGQSEIARLLKESGALP